MKILKFLYAIGKLLATPALMIVCLVQFCHILSLKSDLSLAKHNVDVGLDFLQDKREELHQCEDTNYELTEKVKFAQGQQDYMLESCGMVYKDLQKTTDALEKTIMCRYSKDNLSLCAGIDLPALIEINRHARY